MANCTSCNAQIGAIESFTQRGTGRCKQCNTKFNTMQAFFLRQINDAFQRSLLTYEFEQKIYADLRASLLPNDLANQVVLELCKQRVLIIQRETAREIERRFQDGSLLERIPAIMTVISKLPESYATPLLQRLRYLRDIAEILRGNVPRIQTTLHLDSDEYAHFEIQAIHYKQNKTTTKETSGRLIGTNKKCYFISDTGSDSATIDWNNVAQLENRTMHITKKVRIGNQSMVQHASVEVLHLSVTKGSGGGGYSVSDRYKTKILIDTIVRMWKRQLVIYAETKTTGSIPEHVKTTVFARDKGKCVQCGYEGPYIEYDHRIPRSKGGQNTVENIQLLCRMCNLKKSDRL